ncbi:2OG-Fe(II) oxygenase [Pseudoduganella rhizocola]|uniref:2OG-Fe(II) oxygenase n=1 Tax=Pseudoduganella rhizocola TaxID=3382643 RepID=UPI0038B50C8B
MSTTHGPAAGPRVHLGVRHQGGHGLSGELGGTSPFDWAAVAAELDEFGCAVVRGVLSPEECAALAACYAEPGHFRSRVVMERHGFGRGEYQYFRYPLPGMVAALRERMYAPLAAIANRWYEAMQIDIRFPPTHAAFLDRCHAAGQERPTPLLLQYEAGDYNCLHQDLYGDHVFPLQAAFLLSQPGKDFEGGEFVLTEQRPRMQSRAEVVPLLQGDCVIFPVFHRPVNGTRGIYRVSMRHGVSRLRSGRRHTLGIIFHDAS